VPEALKVWPEYAASRVAAGGLGLSMAIVAASTYNQGEVCRTEPDPSTTLRVSGKLPLAVGVPFSNPALDRVSPEGRGVVADQVTGPVAPEVPNWCEYVAY